MTDRATATGLTAPSPDTATAGHPAPAAPSGRNPEVLDAAGAPNFHQLTLAIELTARTYLCPANRRAHVPESFVNDTHITALAFAHCVNEFSDPDAHKAEYQHNWVIKQLSVPMSNCQRMVTRMMSWVETEQPRDKTDAAFAAWRRRPLELPLPLL